MITPEKNDIDVSKLFHWGDVFTIMLPRGSFSVYVRVVSDEEVNRARVYALRKANELKERIYTEGTDEREAFLPNIDKLKKEEIIQMILAYELPEIHRRATREVNVPFPKEPDENAGTLEWVEYQKEIDEYPNKVGEEINKLLNKELKAREKELRSVHKEVLKSILERRVVENVVTRELENRFLDACVFYGTFKDEDYKERLFESPEQVTKLPQNIREQFVSAYTALDISMEELKK